jgi:response regulator RpfG family c-di-GMP phosphodiesterase
MSEDPPQSSRIIKVANAYDDLLGGSTDRDRAGAALERLRLGAGTAYDPVAIEALARVAGRPSHRR